MSKNKPKTDQEWWDSQIATPTRDSLGKGPNKEKAEEIIREQMALLDPKRNTNYNKE